MTDYLIDFSWHQVIEAFERPTLALVLTVGFQLTAAVASIGRVRTSNYSASRSFNALALGAVAADFAVKYFVTGRGDYLTMQIVFTHRADDLTGLLVFAVLIVGPTRLIKLVKRSGTAEPRTEVSGQLSTTPTAG